MCIKCRSYTSMGEIKIDDLESQNLNISNHSQYLDIEKHHIISFKISPFE